MSCILFFDGACRGNPGPMAIEVVLMKDGKKLGELSKRLGTGTNNIAEWRALIEGLKLAMAHGCKQLQVCGDSDNLIPLFNETKKLYGSFKEIDSKWINREDNARTDTLYGAVYYGEVRNKVYYKY